MKKKPLAEQEKWPGGKANTANRFGERRSLTPEIDEKEVKRIIDLHSRRSFLFGGTAAVLGILGWTSISDETKAKFLERVFRFNENVSSSLYSSGRLAPEFRLDEVTRPARLNGLIGLESEIDTSQWKLNLGGIAGRADDLVLSMDDIRQLPRTEVISRFKCIEGWSTVVQWTGARFSDLVAAHTPWKAAKEMPPYVSLATPDRGYFVGWDAASIMHPQTLLVYEMNGEELSSAHGAPLRLSSPTKYGIKQIKRIGRIDFMDSRPEDYWANEGYDWYSGL